MLFWLISDPYFETWLSFCRPQDAAPSQTQPTVPSSPYSENYQQPSAVPFGRGYNAPPYQPVPQPNTPQPAIFVPSPATPAPMVIVLFGLVCMLSWSKCFFWTGVAILESDYGTCGFNILPGELSSTSC